MMKGATMRLPAEFSVVSFSADSAKAWSDFGTEQQRHPRPLTGVVSRRLPGTSNACGGISVQPFAQTIGRDNGTAINRVDRRRYAIQS